MGWGVFTYIFGGIAIVGPLCLIYWYGKAARQKFKELGATEGGGEGEAAAPPSSGGDT